MRVAVVGQGYVGLTAATCLAEEGHQVTGVESDASRLRALLEGRSPIYEPGLQSLMDATTATGGLKFAETLSSAGGPPDAVIVAVGTPPLASGQPDLSQVRAALTEVTHLDPLPGLVVLKSTVPPGTSARWLAGPGERLTGRYVYNPEFLNQGSALDDWRSPARLVVGLADNTLLPALQELFASVSAPWLITDPTSAETIKYASNIFLATKISFANEVASLCEAVGACVDDVVHGAALDPRIGPDFLRVGIGYGDSCLPKDTQALAYWSRVTGQPMPLLRAVIEVNTAQRLRVIRMIQEHLGDLLAHQPGIAVLGLQYEPASDDVRDAPSRTIVPELQALGAQVRVWDPGLHRPVIDSMFPAAEYHATITGAVTGAAAAIVLTEWPQVREAPWAKLTGRMAEPRLVIDAKNFLVPADVASQGLLYRGIGRPHDRCTPHARQQTGPAAALGAA